MKLTSMAMTRKKLIIFAIILILGTIARFLWTRGDTALLSKRGKIAIAYIESFEQIPKYGSHVQYSFVFNDKQYLKSDEKTSLPPGYFNLYMNKSFPVIIDTLNLDRRKILLTKSDFARFKIAIPDSLKGIVEMTP
jgi:hypothetical protein